MRPAIANIFEDALLVSSMPYISAFSKDGAALITLGIMTSPSLLLAVVEDWRSRRVDRRRVAVIGLDWALLESALPFLPITITITEGDAVSSSLAGAGSRLGTAGKGAA